MRGRGVAALASLFLYISVLMTLGWNYAKADASSEYPVHNLNTNLNYTSIQAAIDANETLDGHTIFVESGRYTERLFVNKAVQLFGENMSTTVIDGNGEPNIVDVRTSNVVLANFSITNSSSFGVVLEPHNARSLNRCTLRHNTITETEAAIKATLAYDLSIVENVMANNTYGLLFSCDNSTIAANAMTANDLGMFLTGANNNVSFNLLEDNFFGLEIGGRANTLRYNAMANNQFNFILGQPPMLVHPQMPENDIDTSNTVNGKSIYYLTDQSDLTFDAATSPEVGFLGLKHSHNITVKDLTLTHNGAGILLVESAASTVENCTLRNNIVALSVYADNTSLANCTISDNLHGISISGVANNLTDNTVFNNTVRHAPYRYLENWLHDYYLTSLGDQLEMLTYESGGIFLYDARNCTISGNTLRTNEHGIQIYRCSFNTFKHNTMTDNAYNFGVYPDLIPPAWYVDPPDPPEVSPYLLHDLDTSNTVNGHPICYWINRHNETVPHDAGYVALVNCSHIVVQNLTLTNNYQGVFLVWVNNILVANNTISHTRYAVDIRDQRFDRSFNNTVRGNTLTDSGIGVDTYLTTKCTITDNTIASNLLGVFATNFTFLADNEIVNHTAPPREEWILGLYPPHFNAEWIMTWQSGEVTPDGVGGVFFLGEYNVMHHNNVRSNSVGLVLGSRVCQSGAENLIYTNNFIENTCGILVLSSNNTLFHNNFIYNTQHVDISLPIHGADSANSWDAGYPAGGNYWSDYAGRDSCSGPSQNETGSDCIGDLPYVISYENKDKYPLKGVMTVFYGNLMEGHATWRFAIPVISNSTLSGFTFNATQAMMRFNVTGVTGDGFCRVIVPYSSIVYKIWHGNFTVLIDGAPPLYIRNWTAPDFFHVPTTYIYFTYHHSTREVVIVSEFPVARILLPLFIIATLMAVMVHRRKARTPCGRAFPRVE